MNWLTIGVMNFVNRCSSAIDKFSSMVHQLRKNTEDLENRLDAIKSGSLFKQAPCNSLGELPNFDEYFSYVQNNRAADVKVLVKSYIDIGQILTKVCATR